MKCDQSSAFIVVKPVQHRKLANNPTVKNNIRVPVRRIDVIHEAFEQDEESLAGNNAFVTYDLRGKNEFVTSRLVFLSAATRLALVRSKTRAR